MHRDRVLEVASVGASYGHGSPNKLRVVSQLEIELGGGTHSRQEHILQVDEWGARREVIGWFYKSYTLLPQSAGIQNRH